MWSARNFVSRGFLDGSYTTTEGCSAAPILGWCVRPTPGAEGTALLLVGQKPTRRRSARSHPARMTRKSITAHHAPHSNVQSRAGFGKLASPANQRLDLFSLLVGQTKRDAILGARNS